MRVDAEKDFHGFSVAGMMQWLEDNWASRRWHGLRRVRVIHGNGEVLPPALREWCDHKGIQWAPESGNPGTTILHPAARQLPKPPTANKPLREIKKRVSPVLPVKPAPPPEPEDSALFEQAVAEIEETGKRTILREKHSEW